MANIKWVPKKIEDYEKDGEEEVNNEAVKFDDIEVGDVLYKGLLKKLKLLL